MTIIGTNGALAVAPQVALAGVRAANYASWAWLPYVTGSLGPISNQENLPPEVSGSLLPGGAYKTGYVVGGQLTFVPRLNSSALHWLLAAFASGNYKCFTQDDAPDYFTTYYGVSSGLTEPVDPTAIPTTGKSANDISRYLSVKVVLPKANGAKDGEIYGDVVVGNLSFQAVEKGTMNMQAALLGRTVTFSEGVSGGDWTFSTTATPASIPLTCVGAIQSPEAAIDLSYATRITVNNVAQFTTPADVQPHFSYSPRDFSILARNAMFVAEFNLDNYDLPRQIFYNGGNSWSPVVWQGTRPFQVEFRSPSSILGASSAPASIAFWARNMAWAAAPMETSGGRIKTLAVVGTVQRNDATADGAEWWIRTTQAVDRTAAWPVV